jgi:tetratricopeptide (TPR) repeat protein
VRVVVLYGLTLAALGCGVSGPASNQHALSPEVMHSEGRGPAVTKVPRTIVTPAFATNVEELFVGGQTYLRQGKPDLAAQAFDRIVQHDPDGPFAERALFQGALAHEASSDLEGAAQRFEQLTRRFPEAPRSAEALVRGTRVRLHLEQWSLAAEQGAQLLDRFPDATAIGRITAYAARALGATDAGQVQEAEYFVSKGLDIVEHLALDRAGRIPRDVAVLYFAQGEARRQRVEAAVITGEVAQFTEQLEQRCQLLLSAQSAYSSTMRAYDAHWSTMAGYRVGELYEKLHEELMRVPAPRAGTPRDQLLFAGAMRLRYAVLLGKAQTMLEHTLAMAARTGEDSEWVRRTERSRTAIAQAMVEEQAALDRLPFTRQDLERALDDLAARATTAKSAPPRDPGAK